MSNAIEIETTEQDAAAEVAAAFDVMMAELEAEYAHRHVDVDEGADVRRVKNLVQDAHVGLVEPLEFTDCPKCEGELCYTRDDVGRQSLCLECGFRYRDAEAANDERFSDFLRDQAIAAGRWPFAPARIGPTIAATWTSVETCNAEVA